jgi:methanogenic corrinoid protein MtbC1
MDGYQDDRNGADTVPASGDDKVMGLPGPESSMPCPMPPEPSRPDLAPLARTIEAEIIPRLMLLHREGLARARPAQALSPKQLEMPDIRSPELAERLLRILLDERTDTAIDFIDRLLIADVPFEVVLDELLSPVARKLGKLWDDDQLSFVEVTIAMTRLQQTLRSYGPSMAPEMNAAVQQRRIFITAVPGETHTFGATVAEAFFVRDGWDVVTEVGLSRSEMLEWVRQDWFDVIGVTASIDASLGQLGSLVRRLREASLNPEVKVVLGGAAFLVDPRKALSFGSDIEACAGPNVVAAVNRMMKVETLG